MVVGVYIYLIRFCYRVIKGWSGCVFVYYILQKIVMWKRRVGERSLKKVYVNQESRQELPWYILKGGGLGEKCEN